MSRGIHGAGIDKAANPRNAIIAALLPVFLFFVMGREKTPAPQPELAAPVAEPTADPRPESPDRGIDSAGLDTELAALRAIRGMQFHEENGWITANDRATGTSWFFTTPAKAAHPAVAKVAVIRRDGAGVVDLRLRCGGTRVGCDALERKFRAYKEKLADDVANADLALDGDVLPAIEK